MSSAAIGFDDVPSLPAFTEELYELMVALDPALWRADAAARGRDAVARLRAQADALLAQWPQERDAAHARLREALERLYAAMPAEPQAIGDARTEWKALYDQMVPRYEAFALALKANGARVQRLRPSNWVRSLSHAGIGLAVILAYELVLTPKLAIGLAAAWCAWAWSLEIGRRVSPTVNGWCMKAFGPIAHEHEKHEINSATWFGTALLLLSVAVPGREAVLGLAALAVGDPAAGIVGRKFGKTKLVRGKSLEGALAFVGAAAVAGLAVLRAFHPELGWGLSVGLAVAAAVLGALIELLVPRIDDNFAIPIGVALGTWALGSILA